MQLPETTKILNGFADTDFGAKTTATHFESSQTTAIIGADVIFRRRNDTRLAGARIIRLIEADIEDN